MTVCKACGAPIRWVVTATAGKPMPLNRRPVDDGNVVVDERGVARVLMRGEEPPPATARYTAHFATCPKAKEFRR